MAFVATAVTGFVALAEHSFDSELTSREAFSSCTSLCHILRLRCAWPSPPGLLSRICS